MAVSDYPVEPVGDLGSPHCAHGVAACMAAVLNVRIAPSLDGGIIGKLRKGERVWVWIAEGEWWWIMAQTQILDGWAFAAWLQADGALTP